MSINNEIQELWDSDQPESLSVTLQKCLMLIQQAYEQKEKLDENLETEIILSANTVLGYGEMEAHAKHIIHLFHRGLTTGSYTHISKFLKLAGLSANILLSTMTNDEQSNDSASIRILTMYGAKQGYSRFDLLKLILYDLIKTLNSVAISSWSFEVLSFVITYKCMLQNFDRWGSNEDKAYRDLKDYFKEIDKQQALYKNWKASWSETNDFNRFTSLMIFGSYVGEESWLDEALSFM